MTAIRISLLLPLALTACMIGEDPTETGALGARGDDVGADALRWDSFSGDCLSTRHGIVAIGGELSLLFDRGAKWSDCTITGVIRVPADIKLTSVYQAVRTFGVTTPIQYMSRLGGAALTTKSISVRPEIETTAKISAYGAQLCARQGSGTRAVPFSITVSVAAAGAYLDSIDWSIGAEPCP